MPLVHAHLSYQTVLRYITLDVRRQLLLAVVCLWQSKTVWYIDALGNKLICVIYKNSVRTSQRTLRHTELVNSVCGGEL